MQAFHIFFNLEDCLHAFLHLVHNASVSFVLACTSAGCLLFHPVTKSNCNSGSGLSYCSQPNRGKSRGCLDVRERVWETKADSSLLCESSDRDRYIKENEGHAGVTRTCAPLLLAVPVYGCQPLVGARHPAPSATANSASSVCRSFPLTAAMLLPLPLCSCCHQRSCAPPTARGTQRSWGHGWEAISLWGEGDRQWLVLEMGKKI